MKAFQYIVLLMLCTTQGVLAQRSQLCGVVTNDSTGAPVAGVEVFLNEQPEFAAVSNKKGKFCLRNLPAGTFTVSFHHLSLKNVQRQVELNGTDTVYLQLKMTPQSYRISEVAIEDSSGQTGDMTRMRPIENSAIYSGMKNEVIVLDKVVANLANNNGRQVFVKVPGLNIWESDGAGIQLGIGGRGLSPNRTSHFNVRQNGHDISADALGYPESYYTPPMDGVQRIEIVRGAASLQYGTQFGGLLNFRMKRGPEDKAFEVYHKQNFSTFGLQDTISDPLSGWTSFTSVGGKVKRLRYYAFHQYKTGSGWRPNSDYEVHTTHLNTQFDASDQFKIGLDLTWMQYLAKQAGGLTDVFFEEDPRQSFRTRNWFAVDWKMAALHLDYRFNSKTQINNMTFGLLANRKALGFLGQTNRIDPLEERDLIWGDFMNVGNETRLVHRFDVKDRIAVAVVGTRLYRGYSQARQGLADSTDKAHFCFLNPDRLEGSDYEFPNRNFSAFSQLLYPLGKHWSLTPGVRYEYIKTEADGTYRVLTQDFAGNVLEDTMLADRQVNARGLLLGGIGANYRPGDQFELYANLSANYRAINFTDIQIKNTSLIIDPDIEDEKGFNADLGVRGMRKHFNYDVSVFLLQYANRIGAYYTSIPDPILIEKTVRYRTNIASSTTVGIECYAEYELLHHFVSDSANATLNWFVNGSLISSKYIDSDVEAFNGNQVELTPPYTIRTGVNTRFGNWAASLQYSLVAEHFSDATNATLTPDGVDGTIPSYQVADVSVQYAKKWYEFGFGINNLFNEYYFTRRASGYPGPGIIPSDGRLYYLSLAVKFTR